jgi:isopenicillin-N N-acyltransferase like protein
MNKTQKSAAFITLFLFALSEMFPCTLWSAAGESVKNGGTLIAKNRDWAPDHKQVMKKISATKDNFAYFGLYAEDDDAPGFKAGINEKNLVVVTASASSIPKKVRLEIKNKKNLVRTILSKYTSVAEVLKDKKIFETRIPMFYMIADKNEIAYIEISIDGEYSITTKKSGVLYHTNHYLEPNFASSNIKIGKSSQTRLKRVEELLTKNKSFFGLDDFTAISNDRNDGANNSIWRTGSKPGAERTLAAWIVELPKEGVPAVYVKLANPDEPIQEFRYKIDEEFWKK